MQEAWAELVYRHQAAVFRAAHAALVSRGDAEDAAQEAWIAAWRALSKFRAQSSFRTWLLTIAWRKALDKRRGIGGWMRMVRLDRSDADDDAPPVQLSADGPTAEDAEVDRAARTRLKRLVKGLPRAHRDALLLVASLPYAEAAAILGIPVGTLKYRVSDARRLLRERMARDTSGPRPSASAKAAADKSALGLGKPGR